VGVSEIQVEQSHYNWRTYNLLVLWISSWDQIDKVRPLKPQSCLEIGLGTGVTGGVTVPTVDVDESLAIDVREYARSFVHIQSLRRAVEAIDAHAL
jgi:hypothetical protein